jgi:hypothetical protein
MLGQFFRIYSVGNSISFFNFDASFGVVWRDFDVFWMNRVAAA